MSRPQRVPRAELRQAILDAARDILDREGVSGLSARAIAREVGYTAASIYNVFGSMSDILMEVNRETFVELEKLIAGLPANEPPSARLHLLCQAYISFMRRNPALWNALFGGTRHRETFPEWYAEAIRRLFGQLTHLLMAHAPGLEPERAQRLTEQLYVAIHGAVALESDRRLDILTSQSAGEIAASVLDAMLIRLKPKA
ncbi:TetR/AcrR family transcriptional regulator [Xinfangfangia sp. D13-10-4-6]|uniref:TetR/AcrR family transcriptional regulator n=1 Tax=Pseudogemmobacter hezensis TaxID=2737662 RepID=UPI0015527CA3|nr:TetR/AcrR family transcriptional regulator [Pseudogemmobacter hezensis]NPD16549.1 TetR/AcrR family transcriptional regulator [Pseudogemmobacter hezensis]